MPATHNPNSIDVKADSHERHRRNWQRLSLGALTRTIKVTSPLAINGSGLLSLTLDNVTLNTIGPALQVKDGGIGLSKMGWATTKGDTIVYDGTNYQTLHVGVDGGFLVADSSQANGIRWGFPVGQAASTYNNTVASNTASQRFTSSGVPIVLQTLPSGYLTSNLRLFKLEMQFILLTAINNNITVHLTANGTDVLDAGPVPTTAGVANFIRVLADIWINTSSAFFYYATLGNGAFQVENHGGAFTLTGAIDFGFSASASTTSASDTITLAEASMVPII